MVFCFLFTVAMLGCNAQVPKGQADRKQLIVEFYDLLFSKNGASISDSKRIFGLEADLWEEGLFMDSCQKKNTEDKCLDALNKWFDQPGVTRSLFFAEIAKKRDSIAPSRSQVENALKRIRFKSENWVELRYQNKKVTFYFINSEEFCINEIFLNSGASIFNDIPGAQKNYLK